MDINTVLRKLQPILGEAEVQRAWEQLQLADAKTAKLIEISLRRQLAEITGSLLGEHEVLLEPIPEQQSRGDIQLGTVHFASRPLHRFGLRRDELIQHTAIFGRSGAGKTNIALLLLRELARQRVPVMVFDWKKNYRDLIALPEFKDLVVYSVGRNDAPFFFNPLVPPQGVAPREWLKKLIEVMQHAYFLGEGVAFVLQEVIDHLYRESGAYEDSPARWPNFRDVLAHLRSRPVKGREAAWMESALRAVGVLCFGAMDWILNSGTHFPIERLLKQQAVLELDAITNSDKTFLIEALLLWIHHYRMHDPGREQLKHVILIEEAHHVLLRKKQELTGAESVTDVILREIREFGEAIVLLDQLPSLISKPALENTFTTICMNLKEKGDVTAASKAMLLEADEARHLGRLPVGSAIIKLQARWPKPFLVRFPLFSISKGTASNRQVKERFLQSLNAEHAASILSGHVRAFCRHAERTIGSTCITESSLLPTEDEHRLLQDVANHPLSPVTDRYQRLGWSARKGTKVISTLEERGYLKRVAVPVPGSSIRLLELMPNARRTLGLPESDTYRFGGLEHQYWVNRISESLRRARLDVDMEVPIGGGSSIDLVATNQDQCVAIEVETSSSNIKANVRKCMQAGHRSIVVAPTRASMKPAVIRILEPLHTEAVTVVLAADVSRFLIESSFNRGIKFIQ